MSLANRRPTLGYIIFAATKHARLLLWTAGALVFGLLFYSCGERASDGKWSEKEVAAKVAYERQQAEFAYRISMVEAEAARAGAAYVAQRLISDSLTRHVQARVTQGRRVVRVTPDTADMVEVCLDNPPGCFPTHREIAAVAETQDSLLHLVSTQLIPQFLAEREKAGQVIDAQRMALTLEREAHEATKGRLADVEKAHKLQHTPTLKQRIATTGKDLAIVGPCTVAGILTVNTGVGMACALVARAVWR